MLRCLRRQAKVGEKTSSQMLVKSIPCKKVKGSRVHALKAEHHTCTSCNHNSKTGFQAASNRWVAITLRNLLVKKWLEKSSQSFVT
jgi:hypothetical protein